MSSTFVLNTVTGGLFPDVSGGLTSLVSGGLFPILRSQPGALDSSPDIIRRQNAAITGALEAQVGAGIVPSAGVISASVGIPIGNSNLEINLTDIIQNPLSLLGQKIFNPDGLVAAEFINDTTTYTGADIRVVIDMVNTPVSSQQRVDHKQLVECTTFTVSVHREKAAVRAAGYINPKAFARGRRTIAGTMVLTQFTVDVLYRFLQAQQLSGHDVSKDTQYVKVDQLPPFNMTLLFTDEFGNVSYRRILGVEFVTDGVVYSTNDMLSEQTVSYMASDFTPLLNIDASALFRPDLISSIFTPERMVSNVLADFRTQFAIPRTNIFSGI